MKRLWKIIAATAVIVLICSAVPMALSLTSVKTEKSYTAPVPLSVKKGSALPVEIRFSDYPYAYNAEVYPADSIESQRISIPYGATDPYLTLKNYGDDWENPLRFTASPAVMTAYGLSDATLKNYERSIQYNIFNQMQFSYDGSEWTNIWDLRDTDIEFQKEISGTFLNSMELTPKNENYNYVANAADYQIKACILGNPSFNFYLTNGPEIINSAYSPADGILYDASIYAGNAPLFIQVDLRVTEKPVYDEETWEPIGTEDNHDLFEEAPTNVTIEGVDHPFSANVLPIRCSRETDTNDRMSYQIPDTFLNTLEVGTYHIKFPYEKGTSVFILQVTENPCDGGEDCSSADFGDLNPDAWYHEAVDFALDQGLMSGTGAGQFSPTLAGSRAQFVTILWNLNNKPTAEDEHPFTDVPDGAWYADAVAWAYEEGIVNGTSETTFSPTAKLNRQQAAAILYNYEKILGGGQSATVDYAVLDEFTDKESLASWAEDAMIWACNEGIISGKGNHTLDPKGLVTRVQIAQIMKNYLN